MSASENTETLRKAIAGWNACKGRSYDCWLDVVTEDVEMFSLADGQYGLPFTKRSASKAELGDYLNGLTDMHEMRAFRADRFVAEGSSVVAFGSASWTTRRTGRPFTTPIVLLAEFRDGKICELREFYDTAGVAASLG